MVNYGKHTSKKLPINTETTHEMQATETLDFKGFSAIFKALSRQTQPPYFMDS